MAIWRVPVRIDWGQPENPAFNVWHLRTVDNQQGAGSALRDGLNALQEFYEDMTSVYARNTTITIGESMIGDPLGSPFYADDDPRVVTGSGSAEQAAALLAVVCSWRTSSATRSGRGRTFVGPLAFDTAGNDATPSPLTMSAIRSAATGLVNSSGGANGWAVGVLSIKQGLLRDITGFTARDRYSYLSSRRD